MIQNPQGSYSYTDFHAQQDWFRIPKSEWFFFDIKKVSQPSNKGWIKEESKISTTKIKQIKQSKKLDFSKVDFQFTTNPNFLSQYYNMREEAYQKDSGFNSYDGSENDFDKRGHIFVAILNNEVIGGVRLMFSGDGFLSGEDPENNFTYSLVAKDHDIDLSNAIYSEVSGMFVQSRFANNQLLTKMFEYLVKECRAKNAKYIFGVCTKETATDDKNTLAKLGIKSLICKKHLAPKKSVYNNVDVYPIIVFL